MDPYCVQTTKRPLSGRGLGHVTKFRNLGTPYNFGMNRDICFKYGTDIEDGPYCFRTTKRPLNGRGLGHDQISKFWDPPNNF